MMQPDHLHPSWPLYNIMDSTSDQIYMDSLVVGDHEFSPSFTTTEDSSGISSDLIFPSVVFTNNFPISDDDFSLSMENIPDNMEGGFEPLSSDEIENICNWLGENEEGERTNNIPSQEMSSIEGEEDIIWSPSLSMKSSEASTVLPSSSGVLYQSQILPEDEMDVDNNNNTQLGIRHLLQAYGEAMEMEQRELAEVIIRCICEKVSPVGEKLERLAFNLFQSTEREFEFLKQESNKNYEPALKAFYQIFPYGRFAHFTANSAILEAMPDDTETIHIVDFDMGEGIQWPPMIEAIGRQQKALRLTSINCNPSSKGSFEETKRRLYDHARPFGLKLKVEEMSIKDLVSEMKNMKKRGGRGREFLAFNCAVGLPHMGKGRSRSHVIEFLRMAKALLANSSTNRGIIAFCDGDSGERLKNCSGYNMFFDECLVHYQALCESMEWNFPSCLQEARLAMETLFVAPFVSSLSWFQKWEELHDGPDLQAGVGLEGCRLSAANLMEAKELVRERENSYSVRIEGQNQNEMVLEWRGIPLLSLSTWR